MLRRFIMVILVGCLYCTASTQESSIIKHRISYGPDSFQFGDLRLPEGNGPFPVVMIVHGGCWLSSYDYTLMDSMAQELTRTGIATWNVEYRRTEDKGGGWPGTFLDVANGLKHLRVMVEEYPLDLGSIVVTGHSAGGHLALMLGAQGRLEQDSELKVRGLPEIQTIVSLAGIVDLESYLADEGCGSRATNLVGGSLEEYPTRFVEGSPISHLPFGIKTILITGTKDNIVPIAHVQPYIDKASSLDEMIEVSNVKDADHFAVITPGSIAWSEVLEALKSGL